jgi:hypothetical protein
MSKPNCRFCGKKFHKKGITNRERRCRKRVVDANPPVEAVNTVAVHPRVRVREAAEAFWLMLSLSEKLACISLFEERSNPY